jgi:hypothetical protein
MSEPRRSPAGRPPDTPSGGRDRAGWVTGRRKPGARGRVRAISATRREGLAEAPGEVLNDGAERQGG